MKNIYLFIALLAVYFPNIWSQSYQKTDLGIKTTINSNEVEIQFYSPSMVRILKWPEGKSFTKESLSVIKTPQKTSFKIKQEGNILFLKSESLAVILNIKDDRISFTTPSGVQLLSEKNPVSYLPIFLLFRGRM
jgi:alpha-D-xyloside xylohydrolase